MLCQPPLRVGNYLALFRLPVLPRVLLSTVLNRTKRLLDVALEVLSLIPDPRGHFSITLVVFVEEEDRILSQIVFAIIAIPPSGRGRLFHRLLAYQSSNRKVLRDGRSINSRIDELELGDGFFLGHDCW